MSEIAEIANDTSLRVRQRVEKIAGLLSAQTDLGVSMARSTALETADPNVASFATNYLARVPNAQAEKAYVAERLRDASESFASAISELVPWFSDPLADAFIEDYLSHPSKKTDLLSVIYEIAAFRPELLRSQTKHILDQSVRQAVLSGAPDDWVSNITESPGKPQLEKLESIARIRTPHAAEAIQSAKDRIDYDHWEILIEMAGRLPDGQRSSYSPSFMGFIGNPSQSPHSMGGTVPYDVPTCPMCDEPTERILTLNSSTLPFNLNQNPSFFWYVCDCDALDFVTIQICQESVRTYFGPTGKPGPGGKFIPGERTLSLEPHPNQSGISMDRVSGLSRHQVGGPAQWITPSPHPRCPGCGNAMTFLASIDSGVSPFGYLGFSGTLFGFWCTDCSTSSTQRQS